MNEQSGVAPYKLPIINEEGSVLREEKDPIRLACLYTLSFVRTGRCTDKNQWAYWSTLWPVQYTKGGGFRRVLVVWVKITEEVEETNAKGELEKKTITHLAPPNGPDGAICVAEMNAHQALKCGLGRRDADGNFNVEEAEFVPDSKGVGKLLVPAKYFIGFAAGALDFTKGLPVLLNQMKERTLERDDADIFADITFIKPFGKKGLKYIFTALSFLGVAEHVGNHHVFSEIFENDLLHPVWWGIYQVMEKNITTWGMHEDGRKGEDEIYKVKVQLVNYLREHADKLFLAVVKRQIRAGRLFNFGNAASAISKGFGVYGNPELVEDAEKRAENEAGRLVELAFLSSRGDFLTRVGRIKFLARQKRIGEETIDAYIDGDVSTRELQLSSFTGPVDDVSEDADAIAHELGRFEWLKELEYSLSDEYLEDQNKEGGQ